jgi:hypothetical protein
MPSRVTTGVLTMAFGAALALGGMQLSHASTDSTGRFNACVDTKSHELFDTLPGGGCETDQSPTSWAGQLSASTATTVTTTAASNDKSVGAGVKGLKSAMKSFNTHKKKYNSLVTKLRAESKAGDQVHTLSDMSQQMQLELQIAVDRQSKLLETISNIVKKLDSTDDSLVNNLK